MKTKHDLRVERTARLHTTQLKLRTVFVSVISRLGAMKDALPEDKRRELAYVQSQLSAAATRVENAGWPAVNVTEFLDIRSPEYDDMLKTFQGLGIKTFVQFCSMSIPSIKVRFRERGLELPIYYEMLHSEYRKLG